MGRKKGRRDLAKERFWRQTIRRQRKSGMTIRAFCEAESLEAWSFSWWRRELVKRDREKQPSRRDSVKPAPKQKEPSPFLPVQLMPDQPEPRATTGVEVILPAGQTIRVASGFDPQVLDAVLHVLEQRQC